LAYESINEIRGRNRIPILVGGSGQYIWAVLEGWEIPRIAPNLDFRKKLEKIAADSGADALYRQLQDLDPIAAQKIDKRNVRRLIRALEVTSQSKIPFSQLQRKTSPNYKTLVIGLTAGRLALYERVDARVDQMLRKGLIAEVEGLSSSGYDCNLPALNSIGYKQIGMMMRNEISLEEASKKIKVDSHRFVRHQYSWFKLKDKRIHWFDIGGDIDLEVMMLLANFLGTDQDVPSL
jgi:tRNA dimethylallyltransferase